MQQANNIDNKRGLLMTNTCLEITRIVVQPGGLKRVQFERRNPAKNAVQPAISGKNFSKKLPGVFPYFRVDILYILHINIYVYIIYKHI